MTDLETRPVEPGLQAEIERLERDEALLEPGSFCARARAIDRIESGVVDRLRYLLDGQRQVEEVRALHGRALALRERLEAANRRFVEERREEIRSGSCRGERLRRELAGYVAPPQGRNLHLAPTYDTLDAFVAGLLDVGPPPRETREREAEMVFYQPTPARHVLEMVERAGIGAHDVFYDVGSGLGQVAILVALLTAARVRGIEYEPAYWRHARACAGRLGAEVEFLNVDARDAPLADGTVFYLYTPFLGRMLRQVLERLAREAKQRPIRVCTYGPCTHDVADQPWLRQADPGPLSDYELAVFQSI